MIRCLATLLFFATLLAVESDCYAQRHRFWSKRAERVERVSSQTKRQATPNLQQQLDAAKHSQRKGFFAPASPAARYWDSAPRFPKYIGGFHSSHFSNLGIPSGDIGFRTNGVYWAPW